MTTADIRINVFSGTRVPIPDTTRLLVTARNGENKNVVQRFVNGGAIRLSGLTVRDNFVDRHTFLISAKDHQDAGFTPLTIKPGSQVLDLMMLRRDAGFTFESFADLQGRPELLRFLRGDRPGDAQALYQSLLKNPPALACLLNIVTALEQMRLVPSEVADVNPMRSMMALESAHADRIFAWARRTLLAQVKATADRKDALAKLAKAPELLHQGATASYKQTDFGEGNVQLSFHETEKKMVGGVECLLVDIDIDYFKDSGAHVLMEVFPNKLKSLIHGKNSAQSVTDPRLVYGLRWIAGRRMGLEFAPPYLPQRITKGHSLGRPPGSLEDARHDRSGLQLTGTSLPIAGHSDHTRSPWRLITIGIGTSDGLSCRIARTIARRAPGRAFDSRVIDPPSPPAPFTFQPAAPWAAAISITRQASRWTRSACMSACAAVLSRIADPSASRSPAVNASRARSAAARRASRWAQSGPRCSSSCTTRS